MELTQSRLKAKDAVQNSNIRILQRKDASITRVLDTASHVVAYAYNVVSMAWVTAVKWAQLLVFDTPLIF